MKTLRLSPAPRGNAALLGKLAMIKRPHDVGDRVILTRILPFPNGACRNRPARVYFRAVRAESMFPGAKIAISGTFRAVLPPSQVNWGRPQLPEGSTPPGVVVRRTTV